MTGAALKEGKPRLALLDPEFLTQVALQMEGGLAKGGRQPGDWQKLDARRFRPDYVSALLRHVSKARAGVGLRDIETGATHWAAVAANCMILDWFDRQIVRELQEVDEGLQQQVADALTDAFGAHPESAQRVARQLLDLIEVRKP
jgi:hypothetical protein